MVLLLLLISYGWTKSWACFIPFNFIPCSPYNSFGDRARYYFHVYKMKNWGFPKVTCWGARAAKWGSHIWIKLPDRSPAFISVLQGRHFSLNLHMVHSSICLGQESAQLCAQCVNVSVAFSHLGSHRSSEIPTKSHEVAARGTFWAISQAHLFLTVLGHGDPPYTVLSNYCWWDCQWTFPLSFAR